MDTLSTRRTSLVVEAIDHTLRNVAPLELLTREQVVDLLLDLRLTVDVIDRLPWSQIPVRARVRAKTDAHSRRGRHRVVSTPG